MSILLDHCIHDELEDLSMRVFHKGFHVAVKSVPYNQEKSIVV